MSGSSKCPRRRCQRRLQSRTATRKWRSRCCRPTERRCGSEARRAGCRHGDRLHSPAPVTFRPPAQDWRSSISTAGGHSASITYSQPLSAHHLPGLRESGAAGDGEEDAGRPTARALHLVGMPIIGTNRPPSRRAARRGGPALQSSGRAGADGLAEAGQTSRVDTTLRVRRPVPLSRSALRLRAGGSFHFLPTKNSCLQ